MARMDQKTHGGELGCTHSAIACLQYRSMGFVHGGVCVWPIALEFWQSE